MSVLPADGDTCTDRTSLLFIMEQWEDSVGVLRLHVYTVCIVDIGNKILFY